MKSFDLKHLINRQVKQTEIQSCMQSFKGEWIVEYQLFPLSSPLLLSQKTDSFNGLVLRIQKSQHISTEIPARSLRIQSPASNSKRDSVYCLELNTTGQRKFYKL